MSLDQFYLDRRYEMKKRSKILEDKHFRHELEREMGAYERDHTPYFLSSDDDGHWYLVKVEARQAWETWRDGGDVDDPTSWSVPDYATFLGGSPSQVEFIILKSPVVVKG